MEREEKWCTGKMKKRALKAVGAPERTTIASEYLEDKMSMAAVASKHHISIGLAGRIIKDYKAGG
jgi:hypothetical protein